MIMKRRPQVVNEIDASVASEEVSAERMAPLKEFLDIDFFPKESEIFADLHMEKNINLLGLIMAMRQYRRYPSIMELGYLYLKPLIRELKKYGQVSYYHYYTALGKKIPNCLLLKVTRPMKDQDLWIWLSDISEGDRKHFPDCADEDTIDGVVPIIDSGRLYFDISNSEITNLVNEIEENCRSVYQAGPDSYVEMIVATAHGLTTQKIKFDFDYSTNDLDLHYGEGFSQFHHRLVERMVSRDKGIVMFHGPPGNGKTHYIRRLLPALNMEGKRVILIPKHILGSLETPAFNQFMLSNFVGQKIVFVMEDAESVIVKRTADGGGRSELVSTLLNITDGILNDVFNIQVVLTFNTSLKEIDDALLRTGRLLAKYEFGNLNFEQAELLANHLGINLPDKKNGSYSLADIYGMLDSEEDTEVLINQHLEKKKKALGFS